MAELQQCMIEIFAPDPIDISVVDKVFHELDTDQDGKLSLEQYYDFFEQVDEIFVPDKWAARR